VLVIPVPIRATDLKANVRERASLLLDELWEQVDLKTPRDRGLGKKRDSDWDHYLKWLWEHKIDGKPIVEIDDDSKPTNVDLVYPSTIRRGLRKALQALEDY
jgi:hypothetical protein